LSTSFSHLRNKVKSDDDGKNESDNDKKKEEEMKKRKALLDDLKSFKVPEFKKSTVE